MVFFTFLLAALMFVTEVPKQGTGWKTTSPELSQPPLNNLNSSYVIRKLFENITFSFDEIFIENGLDKVNYTTTINDMYGQIFTLRPELGSITTNRDTTLEINLNASLNFFMVDAKSPLRNLSDVYSSGPRG